MSSRDDDVSGLALILAGVYAVLVLLIVAVFAVLAFLSFILTIFALFAWNKPRRIGSVVIEPQEARTFVYRGLCGAGVVPAFLIFCDVIFTMGLDWSLLPHAAFVGYVLGSVGVEIVFREDQASAPALPPPSRPEESQAERVVRPLPQPAPKPFRFASWDDEEELS